MSKYVYRIKDNDLVYDYRFNVGFAYVFMICFYCTLFFYFLGIGLGFNALESGDVITCVLSPLCAYLTLFLFDSKCHQLKLNRKVVIFMFAYVFIGDIVIEASGV